MTILSFHPVECFFEKILVTKVLGEMFPILIALYSFEKVVKVTLDCSEVQINLKVIGSPRL